MAKRGVLMTLGIALATSMLGTAQRPDQSVRATAPWTHPRTSWGDPDLEGVWTSDNNFSIPLERPAEVADKEFLEGQDLENALEGARATHPGHCDRRRSGRRAPALVQNLTARSNRSSLIIDPPNGRLPALTAEARRADTAPKPTRVAAAARQTPGTDRSLWDRCITVGLPSVMFPTGYNNNVQILQAPGYRHHHARDDARHTRHPARRPAARLSRHSPLPGRLERRDGRARRWWIDVTNFHPGVELSGVAERRCT